MSAEVRLLLAPIQASAAAAEAHGLHWLSQDETQRLQAMQAPARRASFLAGHWLARQHAAHWLQLDAGRIALDRQADGRPALVIDDAMCALHLSLSHSGDWLAIALATTAVGVDIELPRKPRDLDALARFTFSTEENARLQALPEPARRAAFFRLWTLLEARGKRGGEGLLPQQTRHITTHACTSDAADAMSWHFEDGALALAIDPGAALSVEGAALAAASGWRYRNG